MRQDVTPSLYCMVSAEEPRIDEILRLFFRWQYHEYMFLYREALLLDYLNHEYNGRYCSLALIYSICALGCIPYEDKAAIMTHFLTKAYMEVGSLDTMRVNLTTVQALLCLAYCELALDNISKAWLLSGLPSIM